MTTTPVPTHHSRASRWLASHRWSLILGNLLEHFDSSLYGFLAPLVGKTFFPNYSPLYQLILTYGVYIITFVGRPLGGLFFSQLTYRYGPLKPLCWSLVGVAIPTGLMGLIPGALEIGLWAPLCLILIRFVQSFCAAGESAIAAYYLIEKTSPTQQVSWNGIYQSSTVFGIMFASSLSAYILSSSTNESLWRYAFLLGFILGIWAIVFRYLGHKNEGSSLSTDSLYTYEKALPRIKNHWKLIIYLVPIYGFSYITYSVPFVFLNPYLSQITSLDLPSLMNQTSFLIWLDALILPLMAFACQKFKHAHSLILYAFLFAFSTSLLFLTLPHHSLFLIFSLRLLMIIAGVGFTVSLIPWTTTLYPSAHKYFLHTMGYNIGAEVFGRSTPALCLWIYACTECPSSPLLYILPLSFLAISLILWFEGAILRQRVQA